MNTEQQRIAIAEACGWTNFRRGNVSLGINSKSKLIDFVPNYLNDLNAMHEAEKVLIEIGCKGDYRGWDSYRITLDEMGGSEMSLHTTASRRAEAFLRTLGKWEE